MPESEVEIIEEKFYRPIPHGFLSLLCYSTAGLPYKTWYHHSHLCSPTIVMNQKSFLPAWLPYGGILYTIIPFSQICLGLCQVGKNQAVHYHPSTCISIIYVLPNILYIRLNYIYIYIIIINILKANKIVDKISSFEILFWENFRVSQIEDYGKILLLWSKFKEK